MKPFCLLLFAISWILAGCSDFKDPKLIEPPSPEVSEPDTPDPQNEFRAIIHQGPAPNEYQLELVWNDLAKPLSWQIHRAEGEAELTPYKVIEGEHRSFVDESAEPGKSYQYLLGYTEHGDFVVYGRTAATVPLDVHIDKSIRRSNFKGISRVFLADGAILYVDTPNFEMNVEEIIALGGTIASRHENSRGPYFSHPEGQPETMHITAKRGKGDLKIIARGYRGYRGSKYEISPGKIRLDGTDGGDTPVLKVRVDQASHFDVEVQRIPGKGGEAAPGGTNGRDGRFSLFCLILGDRQFGDCGET